MLPEGGRSAQPIACVGNSAASANVLPIMRLRLFVPVALAAIASLAACGSADDAGSGDPGDPATTVASSPGVDDPSGAWVMVSGPSDPIPGWDVTVEIDDRRIGGTAACNGYGGTVEIGDGTIAVSELSWTEMGCQTDVQQLEQSFLTSLGAATAYSVSDDQLDLTTPQGVWRFDRLAPVPTAVLVGTTWVLDGYVEGDTVSNEPGMDDAFIELSADGTLVGATNCRELSGRWTETGSEIVFTEFSADGECPDDAASDLDGRIISVLGDGFRPEIDGDRLTVTSRGDEGLTFRSA